MKLCGFLITYNEEKKGNIKRCLDNLTKICDVVCVYDDASTDNTVKICKEYTQHIIVGEKNIGFPNKPQKNILMKYIIKRINPDWVYWIDADEITDRVGTNGGIRELCEEGDVENIDAFEFHEINLYLSGAWRRTDRLYDAGWFCRLWRNDGNLRFHEESTLHPLPYPIGLRRIEKTYNVQVIHYGFSSLGRIMDKYLTYKKHGQSGELLERLKPMGSMALSRVEPERFPEENAPRDTEKPRPLTEDEWKEAVKNV